MKAKNLFQYRTIWMGLAILLVMFYHSEMVFHNVVINTLQTAGYGGVDIFMFASGIGCYYSLQQNSDVAEFMKRRFLRIMPVYLVFIVIWLTYKRIFFEMPLSSMIGNLFCVQNFTCKGNEFNWYLSAMWLMYLLAPFFASLANKLKTWRAGLVTILILLAFSVSFWYSYTFIITIARIPIFFVGMFVARKAEDGFIIRKLHGISLICCSILGTVLLVILLNTLSSDKLWLLGALWYPFILIVPGLCYLISLICHKLHALRLGKVFIKGLENIGKLSFELYLVHIFVLDIFQNMVVEKGLFPNTNLYRIFLVIPIVAGCILLHFIGNGVLQITKHLCHSRK